MISGSVVFYKIATTCLLILVGYLARRMKLLPENSVTVLSKYIMYLALPSYFVYHMQSSISMETLGANWYFPLVGILLLSLCDLFGFATAVLWAGPGERGTFRILVGLPNWIFMAMAVCEPLFGADGVRVILLYNVGVMFYFWSFGMTSFRSGVGWWRVFRQLFLNLQILANLFGFALALFVPILRGMDKLGSERLAALPWYLGVLTPFWETLTLLGSTALPLSILQIGLMLGTPRAEGLPEPIGRRSLVLSTGLRLLAAPVLSILTLVLICRLGVPLTLNEFVISVIVMSMPAAVLCLTVAEVYGGATRLAAQGVLWGTLASLATAPLLTWLAQLAYRWA